MVELARVPQPGMVRGLCTCLCTTRGYLRKVIGKRDLKGNLEGLHGPNIVEAPS